MEKVLYREVQRLRQLWIYAVVLAVFAIWLWQAVQQLVMGVPFGTNPAPDAVVVLMGIIPVGILALLLAMRLETVVDKSGIYFRMWPFHRKPMVIRPEDIVKWEVRQYRPIRDYGGWGIRYGWGKNGTAYSMSGKMGAIFDLKSGRRVLIGTRNPEELMSVLKVVMEKAS